MKTPHRALMLVLLVTAVLYLTLLHAPPLNWDDDSNIFANPFFRAHQWAEFWRNAYFGLYVPVTSTVWQILFTLGGGEAWPYRVLNAALHTLNTVLVYRLIARVRRGWPAVFGAAFFALHPLQTATVAWISGGRDLLAATFALTSLLAYLRRAPTAALALFAAALLSKPSVVTLPLVWLLCTPKERSRRRLPWIAAGLTLSALAIWRTLGAQTGYLPEVDWWRRPWLIGDAYWFYLTRLTGLAPLAANYARTPAVVWSDSQTLLTAVIPYALALYAVIRRPAWGRFAAMASLALLPVSGLVSFGYQETSGVADHYVYLSLAAVAALVADSVARVRWPGKWVVSAALALLVIFTVLGVKRLEVWRSNEAFFTDMARAAPEAYATALGLSNVACGERKDYGAGLRWTDVALRARPLDVRALANKAYCLLHAGRPREVADLDVNLDRMDLEYLERTQPTGYSSLLASIGSALVGISEYEVGYQYLCEAFRILPSEPVHRQNLATAAGILRRHDVEPNCEDADDDEPGT